MPDSRVVLTRRINIGDYQYWEIEVEIWDSNPLRALDDCFDTIDEGERLALKRTPNVNGPQGEERR